MTGRVVAALLVVGMLVPTLTSSAQVPPDGPVALDEERDCLELVPASASAAGITDDGDRVRLDVKVLADRIGRKVAMKVMEQVSVSYAPMKIDLHVSVERVRFKGHDADELIQQAKRRFRGTRPRGYDVVYVLTSKDITLRGSEGVAGLADCIGGVRYPEHAFAVGELFDSENLELGPAVFYLHASAKIAAHEIGHLMGAHHHYANCAQGVVSELDEGEASPCSLMFNFLDFISMNFGSVSEVVVRGHAVDHAH